ncbi:SAM-dependent methyltransferase [Sphaerisporangium sp. NPDC051017]|uniref:SAM-dependent methyltransferase n=1 Tax=Sphaerisporangium sp. NPDC051017 TaxID=3154636 RepID=UPI0034490AB1
MEAPERAPSTGAQGDLPGRLDLSTPSVARMYDYFLGGKDNFPVDRERAEQVIRRAPHVPFMAHANRDFLVRVVRYLVGECGIRQIVDIGSGLPTQDNVHQVAQRIDPRTRVVYVDNDRHVLVHARALLAANPNTHAIGCDVREPLTILSDPHVRGVIDFSRPVAVLLCAVLHFIADADDPYGIVATLVRAITPGSYVVVSHAERHRDLMPATSAYNGANASAVLRSAPEIRAFFDGLELVTPGVVPLPRWRPEGPLFLADDRVRALGGAGCKP